MKYCPSTESGSLHISPSHPWPSCQDSLGQFRLLSVPLCLWRPFAIFSKYTRIHNQLTPGKRVVSTRHVGCPLLNELHEIFLLKRFCECYMSSGNIYLSLQCTLPSIHGVCEFMHFFLLQT